jgi:hypothetical protein
VDARAEARHVPSGEPSWEESYSFTFFAPDASLGGYVRLGLFPNHGLAWYWAALAGPDRPLVTVLEHDAPVPRKDTLELRTSGLWSEIDCETPFDHFTVALEAFGLAVDVPDDVYGDLRGERVPLGLDLEWDTDGAVNVAPDGGPAIGRYAMACRVHGEILVGQERIEFDGLGERGHAWGVSSWWTRDWCRVVGRTPAGSPVDRCAEPGDVEVTAWAPVYVSGPDGRSARLARGLARLDRGDGGAGWVTWNRPER